MTMQRFMQGFFVVVFLSDDYFKRVSLELELYLLSSPTRCFPSEWLQFCSKLFDEKQHISEGSKY